MTWLVARNKYGNVKAEADGMVFDSRKERERYLELKLLVKAKEIRELVCQPRFLILEKFGKDRARYYVSDFAYFEKDDKGYYSRRVVEDCKGYKTETYKLKKAMFIRKYPDVDFREII